MTEIRNYTEADKLDWDAYVMQHPESTVFHLTAWKDVIEQTFGHKSHYFFATRDKKIDRKESGTDEHKSPREPSADCNELESKAAQIVGILPVFRVKSLLFGNYLVSVPFAEIGGAIAEDSEAKKMLLDQAAQFADSMDCDYLEIRNRNPYSDWPTKPLYYNFRRKIYADLDDNMQVIPRKQRRMIRQGEKFGLAVEFGHHLLDQFYDIIAKSFHNLGTPIFSKRFFINFLAIFKGRSEILLIRTRSGEPIAAVLTFFFKNQVIPYYAGSLWGARKQAPNDFMYWELMKYGCENGYKIFDFGRSKVDTGSFHFKRHWGFEPEPLAYQYHFVKSNGLPNLSPSNPKYQKKIELWRKLPSPVTKILGPPIAKYLA